MKELWIQGLTDEKLMEWVNAACREIDRRWKGSTEDIVFKQSQDVFCHFHYRLWAKKQEHLYALLLDNKHALIEEKLISIGTVNASLVHAREVFSPAVEKRASSIVLIHNHPSGMAMPSSHDLQVTKRLKRVGKLMGIQLVDHIIIGKNQYYSDHLKKVICI